MTYNWKHIAAGFLIGCIAGGAVGARFQKAAYHKFWKRGPNPERMLKKFDRELKLDAGQKAAVKAIITGHREKMMALHEKTSGAFQDIRLSMHGEIAKVLNPDQRKKFDEMKARWEARRRRFHQQEAPPGGKRPSQ